MRCGAGPTGRRPRRRSRCSIRSWSTGLLVDDCGNTWVGSRAARTTGAQGRARPAVLVIMNTAVALCREPNRLRDRLVSASLLTDRLGKISRLLEDGHLPEA